MVGGDAECFCHVATVASRCY